MRGFGAAPVLAASCHPVTWLGIAAPPPAVAPPGESQFRFKMRGKANREAPATRGFGAAPVLAASPFGFFSKRRGKARMAPATGDFGAAPVAEPVAATSPFGFVAAPAPAARLCGGIDILPNNHHTVTNAQDPAGFWNEPESFNLNPELLAQIQQDNSETDIVGTLYALTLLLTRFGDAYNEWKLSAIKGCCFLKQRLGSAAAAKIEAIGGPTIDRELVDELFE